MKRVTFIIVAILFMGVISIASAMDSSVYDNSRNRLISVYSAPSDAGGWTISIEVRDSSGNLISSSNLPNLNGNPDIVANDCADGEFSLSYNETSQKAYILYTDTAGVHKVVIKNLSSSSGSDTQPPTVPTGLTATAVSSSQINLSWNASTDNVGVAGYKVYKNGSYLKSVISTSTSIYNLSANTRYCFKVSAYDSAGNESSQSTEACATTQNGGGTGNIDLQPTLFWSDQGTTIYKGGQKTFQYKVKNNGTSASGTYTIKIYLSIDKVISSEDFLLKSITATSIPAGTETAIQYVTVTNPTNLITHQDYWYILKVDPDNQITETDENNNQKNFWGTVP